MCIKKMSPHYSMENPVSQYDTEPMSLLKLCGRTNAKVNECVDAINQHMKDCKAENERHEKACADTYAEHLKDCDQAYATHLQACADKHDEQVRQNEEARQYMKDNLEENCQTLFDNAVANGVFDTITREAYERMSQGMYNVLDWGAVGDGVTDDTLAIQTAIDYAREYGKGSNVYLPAGEYVISNPLTIYSHTRLIGSGKRGLSSVGVSGTHIIGKGGIEAIIKSDPNEEMIYGAEIRDIRVCAGSDERTYAYGLYLNGVSECYLQNVTVNGGFSWGMYFKGGITNLDNLYICANETGLVLEDCHATTISNLNAWKNDGQAIVLCGSCCNVVVRDSWIENSTYGVVFDNSAVGLTCYNTVIQNTSFTAGSDYSGAQFIKCVDTAKNVETENVFCVQGLRVTSCVAKIHTPGGCGVEIGTSSYTVRALFEGNTFFTNTSYNWAIKNQDEFNTLYLRDNVCQNYDGTKYLIINSAGNYINTTVGSKYTEIESRYPLRLMPTYGALQSYDEGQIYYKNGELRITDGNTSRIIPSVGNGGVVKSSATTVEELKSNLNDLIQVLYDNGLVMNPLNA